MAEYREIFEKIPDGVTLHDATDGAILDTNQQFCEMLGYTREELLNLDFEALHVDEPPFTNDRAAEYIRKAATEGPQTFEWLDQTKAGDPLPVEVTLRQATIDGEQRILAVVRDITDRKRRERLLERRNERLERFAGIVSHDLRNPLNVIDGRLALAREDGDSDHLDAMEHAVDRMDELIDTLLAMARSGESPPEPQPVELATVCEAGWTAVATSESNLALETDLTVRATPSRLQQLVENLVRNAVEHGGDTVTVGELDREPGFFVEDDGPGLPVEDPTVLFEPTYSTSDAGAGIGLSIVEQIVDEHGWEIRATEGPDGGARFEITGLELE